MFENIKIKICICCVFVFGVVAGGNAAPDGSGSAPATDVRVLIDVSGSMKLNDPGNIRIPALKLLVNLLPPDSRAGIWLFAAESTALVPLGNVDNDWKSRSLDSATGIHSRGLFTNIEDALNSAMDGWETAQDTTRKSIILLTDGVVDVSKDPGESVASRTAIIDQIVPELQRLSAQVHTIALSENADHELLKKLSFDTGGWSKSVQSAQQLQRVFLKMFQKAIPRDAVPLTDNKFTIDAGINEFSIIVFLKPGAQPTRLIDPNQAGVVEKDFGENVKWHHEVGYDLITIQQPEIGEWQLVADVDPDNQVMVVTDLKLELTDLPNYVSENEPLDIAVRITEKGKTLIERDFLNLVEISLQQSDDLGRTKDWVLQPDLTESGYFTQAIGETLSPGKHTFKVVVNGRTFQRQTEHRIEVVENPIAVDVARSAESGSDVVVIRLIPDHDIIDIETMNAEVSVNDPLGEQQTFSMGQADGVWEMEVDTPPQDERVIINFSVTAKTLRGSTVHPRVRPIVLDKQLLSSLDDGGEEVVGESLESHAADQLEEQPDWALTGIITGVVNLVLIVGGFFLYRFIRKRLAKQEMQLLDRLAT